MTTQKLLRVACAALNQTPLDWDTNTSNIRVVIERARSLGVSILCLPELAITGYGCEDWFLAPAVQARALELAQELAQETKGLVVGLGLPLVVEGRLYDAVAVAIDGKLVGFVCKQFLCREGLHYEPRFFDAWPAGVQSKIKVGKKSLPVGDLLFSLQEERLGELRIGFEICEDAWSSQRPGSRLAAHAVDIILNPSASHFGFNKFETRKRFVLEGSRAFGAAYLYANLLGNEAGRAIYDGTRLIASRGELAAAGTRFSFRENEITTATIDIDVIRVSRQRSVDATALNGEIAKGSARAGKLIASTATLNQAAAQEDSDVVAAAWENGPTLKHEEFARAVALGLFDYLRKSHSKGFVLSLSGGADSAAIACLCRLMVRFAWQARGADEFSRAILGGSGEKWSSEEQAMKSLLLTVYQSTKNSGEVTRVAAKAIAQALGASFSEISIDKIVEEYTALAQSSFGRPLSWEKDDIALQNIQARVRGPSVWLLANLRSALLLATSNRSEAAVGYTTMDGDTCGGLSPIAGIDKAYLRQWLRWLEKDAPQGCTPIAELSLVNKQAPTAELRPAGMGQTDEGDLMPYEILDQIERLMVREKKLPREIFEIVQSRQQTYSALQLKEWIEKFFTLWSRNQWKRERYAPSFHLDDESLDPRGWCRFPILSGGFRQELGQLRNSKE